MSYMIYNPYILPVAAALLLCLYMLATTFHQYRRLRHFPGPPSAGFSKWWWLRSELSGEMNFRLLDVSEKYGK